MASNPLSVPITGGTPEPYVAGLGIQAPKITGSPIAAPSNVSEILALLNGTAQTVANTHEQYRRNQDRNKQDAQELDHTDLLVLQKEADLWKTMGEDSPIIFHSDAYKSFEGKLKAATSSEGRTPYYQAGVANILENSASNRVNTLYTVGARAQAVEDRADSKARQAKDEMEHHGRMVAQSMEPQLEIAAQEAKAQGLSPDDAEKFILNRASDLGALDIPEARAAAAIVAGRFKASMLNEMNTKVATAVDDRFTTAASDLKGLPQVLANPRLDDESLRNRAVSNTTASIDSEVAKLGDDYTAASLSLFYTKMDDVKAGLDAIPDQYKTPAQHLFADKVSMVVQNRKQELENRVAAKVYRDVKTAVDTRRRLMNVTEEDSSQLIANVTNDILGTNAVTFNPVQGYTANDPMFNDVIGHLNDIQERVHDELRKDAPKIEALRMISGGAPIESSPLSTEARIQPGQPAPDGTPPNLNVTQPPVKIKAIAPQLNSAILERAEWKPEDHSPEEISYVLSRMAKGTDLGKFKDLVTNVIQNPRGPDGQPDVPRIQKMMAVLKGTDFARSGILQNYTGLNDPESMQLFKASIWSELDKVRRSGGLSDLKTRQMLEPIVGFNKDPNDMSSFMNFVYSPSNPAGSEKTNPVERNFDQTMKDYDNHLVAGSPLKQVFSMVDMAMAKEVPTYWDSGSKDLRMATRKVAMHALGISLVDDGTTITPVRDTYGHVPEVPNDTMEAAVNFVPDAGSYLHTSTLYKALGREPTPEEVKTTSGMSVGKMFTIGIHPKATDPGRWSIGIDPSQMRNVDPKNFSVVPAGNIPDDDMMVGTDGKPGATFERSPLSYVRQGDKIYIKGLSDQSFNELFGFGLAVKGTGGEISGFHVNSTFESIYKNAIENNRVVTPATPSTVTSTPAHSVLRDSNRASSMMAR